MGASQCEGNVNKQLKIVLEEQRYTGHGRWISDELSEIAGGIGGIGQKTLDTMRRYVTEHESPDQFSSNVRCIF